MPLISEFYGIKIYMYWEEHLPPHFHAEYGNFKVYVNIQNSVVIKGAFPAKQLKLVLAWSEIHKDELMENWNNSIEYKEFKKINPLV